MTGFNFNCIAHLGAGVPVVAVAAALVVGVKLQEALTDNGVAVHGSSFEGGGGGIEAQMLNVPLLLLPNSHTRTKRVVPGV